MPQFITLKIGETKSGKAKTLHALRTTADYYGWTEHFPVWTGQIDSFQGERGFLIDPGRRGHPQCSGGKRLRICRSPSRDGYPAGFTNAFKVTANTGLFDLAELAHFTKGDWHWLQDTSYQKVSRADWERRYARTFH